jgi:hypothetical protein
MSWVYCCCCWFNCACCRSRKKSKQERIFGQAQRNLYNEIDVLEIVKQLRISKFLASFLLTSNQRELVKFMKQYTLSTRVPKLHRAGSIVIDTPNGEEVKRTPFEDLLDYKPLTNKVDKLLHRGILGEAAILDDESR